MAATYHVNIDRPRSLLRLSLSGFFDRSTLDRFVAERNAAVVRLGCRPNRHVTLCDLTTCQLSSPEIVADLDETLGDLYVNAGEHRSGPLLDTLDGCKFPTGHKPSDRLVALMDELLTHGENQRAPRAQELFSEAVREIKRLHDAAA